ncbi:hypothetical protein EIK77_010672 [Talaromyces pinophilus]|nr:hypothetical protein EIK77_010672 [Talaromyces pinophilus]
MHIPTPLIFLGFSLGLAMATPAPTSSIEKTSKHGGNPREYLESIVKQLLDSIVAHDSSSLPLATVYKMTENSHPVSVTMSTTWRTITKAESPSLLAIDTTNDSAYFVLDISEGNDKTESILHGRVKVDGLDGRITELELFINRSRGDDGFAFSAAQLAANYKILMSPPANRKKASRKTLENLGEAVFDPSNDLTVNVSDSCQFTEVGWKVVDTGTWGNDSSDPLSCSWPSTRPGDANARANLVVDEELGFVITSGMVPGKVYPYIGNISTFIPDSMTSAQEAQVVWYDTVKAQGNLSLLAPTEATGENMEVLQYYNDELQAMQLNVYLNGPNMTSAWL